MTIDREAECLPDEAIAAWSAGELSADERERAIEHVASCDRCRAVLAHVVEPAAPIAIAIPPSGVIGRYEIRGPLGAGGMGVVLRGRDPVLGREVAIKMMRANLVEPEHRDRMLREAQAMARISHPNVVTVHEFGEAGDEVYVAMELVEGTVLQRWLAAAPRSPAERLAVALGVGRGLAAVHAAGVLHRDIKPDNIVVRDDGTPVVVDFGLARPTGATALGSGSGAAGTRLYLAPEIAAGKGATAASDQYQWWTIVEEALGERAQTPRIAAAIGRGHDPDPVRRYPDQRAAVAALERAAAPRRRGWLALAGAGLALVAVAAGLALWRRGGAGDGCDAVPPTGWTLARRAAIAGQLRIAGLEPLKVVGALDARAAATAELRTAACRALAGSPADRAEWARRQVCVDEAWASTRTALGKLEHRDPDDVREAVDDLAEVLPVERCARGFLPAAPEPLPPDRDARYRALVKRLQVIESDATQRPPARTAQLRSLAPEIEALHYPPLDARWHWAIAHTQFDARDTTGAVGELDLAAQAALAAGDDNTYVRALISRLQATSRAAPDDVVAQLEQQAIAGAKRLGNPQIDAQLLIARADFQMERGASDRARALFEEADRLYDRIVLAPHPMQVMAAQNIGGLCVEAGDLACADRYLERAVELARRRYTERGAPYWEARGARAVSLLGRKRYADAEPELRATAAGIAAAHPAGGQLGMTRAFLCAAVLAQGDPARARPECAASVAAMRSALGPDTPGQVWPLTLSGQVELRAHAPAAALPFLRRAVELAAAGHVRPIEATVAEAYLAIALAGAGDRAAARALAARVAPRLAAPEVAETRIDFVAAFPDLTARASPHAK